MPTYTCCTGTRKDLCFRSFSEELFSEQGQLLRVTVDATTNKSLQTYFPFQEPGKVSALSHFEKEKQRILKDFKF